MIVYESRWLTHGEVWYDEEPDHAKVDYIVHHQRTKPLPQSRWREFYTLVLDLRCRPEVLLSQMPHPTPSRIKRARDQDRIVCEFCDASNPAVVRDFADFYDRFAGQRGLNALERAWLETTAQAGALDILRARSPEGETLVYRSVLHTKTHARDLHSASFFRDCHDSAARSYLGRANRLLNWFSILHYQEQGVTTYDLGGWYHGNTDQERLRINAFKKGMGGEVVCHYECEQILSGKGWLVLGAARALHRLRSLRLAHPAILTKTCENTHPTAIPDPVR